MKKITQVSHKRCDERTNNALSGGLPVRTNLPGALWARLTWDNLDDKAKELWGKLTSAVSSATNTLTAGSDAGKPSA